MTSWGFKGSTPIFHSCMKATSAVEIFCIWFIFCLKCQWHLLQNYHIYLILCLSALMDSTMDPINSCYVWQWLFSFFSLANRRTAAHLNPALVNLASIVIIIIMRTWSVKTARAVTGCHCLLTLHSPYVQVVETCHVKRLQAKCVCVAAARCLWRTCSHRRWWNIKALILDLRWLVPLQIEKLLMKLLAHNMQVWHSSAVWYAWVSFMSVIFNWALSFI